MGAQGCWLAALLLMSSGPPPDHAAPPALTPPPIWSRQEQWRLVLEDERGKLRLDRIATPGGDELLTGSLRLDDAELGVSGTGRRRGDHLIFDVTIVGGVLDVTPDAGKQSLFAPRGGPARLSSTGFAMLHADLDAVRLNGATTQYQTNIVIGDHLRGPVLRVGRLEHQAPP